VSADHRLAGFVVHRSGDGGEFPQGDRDVRGALPDAEFQILRRPRRTPSSERAIRKAWLDGRQPERPRGQIPVKEAALRVSQEAWGEAAPQRGARDADDRAGDRRAAARIHDPPGDQRRRRL
jgi:hypothetical protein